MKAIFLDRDGVLIKDTHLVSRMEDVHILPHVEEGLTLLKQSGFKLFLITNQAVVARGILSLEKTLDLNAQILKKISSSPFIDETFLCPHHPKATVLEFRQDCECRKPKSGMILAAQKKYQLDLSQCVVIGDRPTDIYAGKKVGCRGFQVLSGEHEAPLIETTLELEEKFLKPDRTFPDLMSAAKFLKGQP